jgi:hypothetical protein
MKMEHRAAMNKFDQTRVSINDIKYDLIKIIEPYDGILDQKPTSESKIRNLFSAYLKDLQIEDKIQDYTILSTIRDTAITYDVAVKMAADRSAKKLKIHVGVFQAPWVNKAV